MDTVIFSIADSPEGGVNFTLESADGAALLVGPGFTTQDACTDGIQAVMAALPHGGHYRLIAVEGAFKLSLTDDGGEALASSAEELSEPDAQALKASLVEIAAQQRTFDVKVVTEEVITQTTGGTLTDVALLYDFTVTSITLTVGVERFDDAEAARFWFHLNDQRGQPLIFTRSFKSGAQREQRLAAVLTAISQDGRQEIIEEEGGAYWIIKSGNGREIARSRTFTQLSALKMSLSWLIETAGAWQREIKKPTAKGHKRSAAFDGYDFTLKSQTHAMGFETLKLTGERPFFFIFNDQDGIPLLFSQGYKGRSSRDNGLRSVIKNGGIQARFTIKEGGEGWYFILKAGNHQELGRSRTFNTEAEVVAIIAWFRITVVTFAAEWGVTLTAHRRSETSFTLNAPEIEAEGQGDDDEDDTLITVQGLSLAAAAVGGLVAGQTGEASSDERDAPDGDDEHSPSTITRVVEGVWQDTVETDMGEALPGDDELLTPEALPGEDDLPTPEALLGQDDREVTEDVDPNDPAVAAVIAAAAAQRAHATRDGDSDLWESAPTEYAPRPTAPPAQSGPEASTPGAEPSPWDVDATTELTAAPPADTDDADRTQVAVAAAAAAGAAAAATTHAAHAADAHGTDPTPADAAPTSAEPAPEISSPRNATAYALDGRPAPSPQPPEEEAPPPPRRSRAWMVAILALIFVVALFFMFRAKKTEIASAPETPPPAAPAAPAPAKPADPAAPEAAGAITTVGNTADGSATTDAAATANAITDGNAADGGANTDNANANTETGGTDAAGATGDAMPAAASAAKTAKDAKAVEAEHASATLSPHDVNPAGKNAAAPASAVASRPESTDKPAADPAPKPAKTPPLGKPPAAATSTMPAPFPGAHKGSDYATADTVVTLSREDLDVAPMVPGSMEAELLKFAKGEGPSRRTFVMNRLRYPANSHTVNTLGKEQIYYISQILAAYPNIHLEIHGHNDPSESEVYTGPDGRDDLPLSILRADCVLLRLTWLGISPSRLTKVGHGSKKPVTAGTSPVEQQANRRVEVVATRR